MKKIVCTTMLTLLIVGTLMLSLSIQPVQAQEPALITILHTLGFINIIETTVETFPAGTYEIKLLAEFTAAFNANKLSRYKVGTSEFVVIFSEPEGNQGFVLPPIAKSFIVNHEFGLSLKDETRPERFFTETHRNPDQTKHVTIYQNLDDPSMFLIGFEDVPGGGDHDYQDMVISLKIIGPSAIEANIDFDPYTLNLRSNGEWITAYVELPEGYSVNDINVATILLNDTIPVDIEAPVTVGDYDSDSVPDLMVKFNRASIIEWLGAIDHTQDTGRSCLVALTLTGEVSGTTFEGSDTINVLHK